MEKTINKLFKSLDVLLGILLGVMVALVLLNVILRTVFNSGLTWSEELARYIFMYITFIGAIGAMHSNSHLGMDTFIRRFPPVVKRISYITSQLLIFILMGMLGHGSYIMTIQSLEAKGAGTGIPLSLVYGIGIVTAICIGLNSIINIIKAVKHPKLVNTLVLMHESEEEDVADTITTNTKDKE